MHWRITGIRRWRSVVNVPDGVIPDWAPCAVVKVAPNLPEPNHNRRLLCDDRMEAVWRELRKRAPPDLASKLQEHERRLMKLLGLLSKDVSVADQACAAFVISVARTIWNPGGRLVWTKAEAKKKALQLEEAAAWCRWFATDPMFAEDQVAAAKMVDVIQKHAISMRERGHPANFDQQIKPFVLERSSGLRGDDKIRGYTRAIAADARRLFGEVMYGTLATIMSVALQQDIDERRVQDWCTEEHRQEKRRKRCKGLPSQ
jgi:hypothetical protein